MKSYKLVNSREVQEKAFRLGYGWYYGKQKEVMNLDCAFLFLDEKDMEITQDSSPEFFSNHSCFQEITQADFLALPGPIKVGDWVRVEALDEEYVLFGVLKDIDSETFNLKGTSEGYFVPMHTITKLTKEQIKEVL